MSTRIVVVGAGVGGLTSALLLAKAGHQVTVLESQAYPGGCAGTFYHKGYRFDAGATVAGGFQPGGPHARLAELTGIRWPIRQHDPAWVVHTPGFEVALRADQSDVRTQFPASEAYWQEQQRIADLGWALAGEGLPWPPESVYEALALVKQGVKNAPGLLSAFPFAFSTAAHWLQRKGLEHDQAFVRLIDAQLLISAQATSKDANAFYAATALDLPRQGVYHVEGGMGGISQTLVDALKEEGGQMLFRQRANKIMVERGRVTGVMTRRGETFPADFVIANLTPQSLDKLLEDEAKPIATGHEWGAFVLHLGVRSDKIPRLSVDHHQILASEFDAMGEGESIFMSLSPEWDASRAPAGHRAVTVSTHTRIAPWFKAAEASEKAYENRKSEYTQRVLHLIERYLPGFGTGIELVMPGTPLTYEYYTSRASGMVGGNPQTSLFAARGSKTGIANLRLVGDSVFPGQSTAGVTLGAMRVVREVLRTLPKPATVHILPGKYDPAS